MDLFSCCWDNTVEHVVYNSKVLTNSNHDFLFRSNLHFTEEPKESNENIDYLCWELKFFIKPLPVSDKQIDSCPSIYYKPPQVLIKEKDNENLTRVKLLAKMERPMNPTSMGSQIHPI